MPTPVRNILAVIAGLVIAGLVIGGSVNMALVVMSPAIIPPPLGVDVNNAESLSRGIHLFEPRHFVMPFLAHALGTFAGALVAYLIAATVKLRFAYAIGVVYLCGGIVASFMIPAPAWFIALDLLAAYLPMAWLAIQAGSRLQRSGDAEAKPVT